MGVEVDEMKRSQTYDPSLHESGSEAAAGRCSFHGGSRDDGTCAGEAVVSFEGEGGRWEVGLPHSARGAGRAG